MLSAPKSRPMPRSAKLGMLVLALTVGTMLTFFTFLPPVVRNAQAANRPAVVPVEQVITFACSGELGPCVESVGVQANEWLRQHAGKVEITARLANIGVAQYTNNRGYAVTIFYQK